VRPEDVRQCLAELVEYYLDELIDEKTVVLILSDGLDRGDLPAHNLESLERLLPLLAA